jgi:TatD DNase family protein
MLIDTHTHLFLPEFDTDRSEVVERAIMTGINKMILPNVDESTIMGMLSLSDNYPENCYPAIGLHPGSVRQDYREELEKINRWLDRRKFYAIGETGIDLYWNQTFLEEQTDAFRRQIGLAQVHHLPLIIHCRNSFNEIISVIKEMKHGLLSGVFHSFTGNKEQADLIIDNGFKIGIGGIVTYKNSGLDQVLQKIDIRHIVIETDAPYLTPVPYRGKRNESSYLIHTARKLAEIYQLPVGEVAAITSANARIVFNL